MNAPSFQQEPRQRKVVVFQSVVPRLRGRVRCGSRGDSRVGLGLPAVSPPCPGEGAPARRGAGLSSPSLSAPLPRGPGGSPRSPARPPAPGTSRPGRRTRAVVDRQTRPLFVQGLGRQFGGNSQTAHSAASQHFSKTAWSWLGLADRGGRGPGARNRAGESGALRPAG